MNAHVLLRLSIVLAALIIAFPASATTIQIVNADGTNEGFNDPTPATPVGGNTGTTIGEQRLIVFQAVADRWERYVHSDVDAVIHVVAQFNPMGSGVLGSCGSISVYRDFPNAPLSGHWFSVALANAIAGYDMAPAANEISAQFNSAYANWYYGLDGPPGGAATALFAVVMHELAHGLGFQTFADEDTGQLFNNYPDHYTYYTYDPTLRLTWDQMTNAERISSATKYWNLTWNGPRVTGATPSHLTQDDAALRVDSPPAIADSHTATCPALLTSGAWGGALTTTGLSGTAELVTDGTALPNEGCNALVGFTAGNIALVDRGTCEFGLKCLNAQTAGAIGCVVVNQNTAAGGNNPDGLLNMGAGTYGASVTIPAVMIAMTPGDEIKSELPGATVTMGLFRKSGANPHGWALLYSPEPTQPGSSISHFDDTMVPNALMEYAINADTWAGPDLTVFQFEDVWWPRGELFADGFETGDWSNWFEVVP